MVDNRVEQTALTTSLTQFVEKNLSQKFTPSKPVEKDCLYSSEGSDTGKYIASLMKRRPDLAEGNPAEGDDVDLGNAFKEIAKMFYSTLEVQLNTEQELSNLNRDMGVANLQVTENTWQKQGNVLEQQQKVQEKIASSGKIL